MSKDDLLKPGNTGRQEWLDAIKGLAIILVILSHTRGLPYVHGYMTNCYMQLFFIASGYVYSTSSGSITKKVKKLIYPYICWCIFYLIINAYNNSDMIVTWITGIIYSRHVFFAQPTEDAVKQFPPGAMPMWFLTCMALSYIAFIPLLKSKGKTLLSLILLYLAISSAFSFCPVLLPWSLDTAFLGALMLYTGYRLKGLKPNKLQSLAVLLICGVIYIFLVDFNGFINMSLRVYGEWPVISVILFLIVGLLGTICYSCFFILTENSILCRFFAYFGRLSLTMMCSHMLCVFVYNWIYSELIPDLKQIPSAVMYFPRLFFILLMCVMVHYLLVYTKRAFRKIRGYAS